MIVGIDISKDWLDAAWREAQRLRSERYEYTAEGLQRLLKQAPAGACFVMEATGVYHARAALALFEAGRQVSVVNPLVIKRYGQMHLARAKSDSADARLIMRYGEQQSPAPWRPASEQVQALQQAHGWLHDLLGERTRLLNRQHAHQLRGRPSTFVQRQMHARIKRLEADIAACEQHLQVLVKKTFEHLYVRLQSIPAIGPKTAIELIIVTDGFTRFDDVKALCAYIGVSPSTFESGSSVRGNGGIAKMGNGRMRQLLYMCSWTARQCNPACARLYQRLQAAGKPAKVINIAIAHKLLRQAFAVATKNQVFSTQYA